MSKLLRVSTCFLEINRYIYRLIIYILLKKRHQKLVSVTYGSSNKHIHFTSGMVMQFVRALMMKWKRGKSTHRYTRIDEFSKLLFDAIHENTLELAKNVIDDGKVVVNIKDGCGDPPLLIAVCQHTMLRRR